MTRPEPREWSDRWPIWDIGLGALWLGLLIYGLATDAMRLAIAAWAFAASAHWMRLCFWLDERKQRVDPQR